MRHKLLPSATVIALVSCIALAPAHSRPAWASEQTASTAQKEGKKEKKSIWKKMFGGVESSVPASEANAPATGAAGSYRYSDGLGRAQSRIRVSAAADQPEVRRYLDLVDQHRAGPEELAAFGNLLAGRGLLEVAAAYYREALRLDPQDPVMWTNLGTILRQQGDSSGAKGAFHQALELDPGMAVAHYDLGALLDSQGDYDAAIREYVTALTLDPSLADPESNPQVVNNPNILAARLIVYQRQAGSQGLPLIPTPGDKPAPE